MGLIKKEVEFQRVTKKNNVEIPGVVVLGLGSSKGSNTILWIIQGLNEKCMSKYFSENTGPVLDRLVSSTFDMERMTPQSEFSPGLLLI